MKMPEFTVKRKKDGRLMVSVIAGEKRRVQIDLLKQQRSQLKKYIPRIRHTVSKHQAIKKQKKINYIIGRMVFFEEDFKTAVATEKKKRKAGEL